MTGFCKYLIFLVFVLIAAKKASTQSNIEWPAAIVEMHYNNTGPDVNQYIEIHEYYMNSPFYFPFGLDGIHELRFFDNGGLLYKTLQVSSMSHFYSGGWGNYGPHVFSYYQFPPGEDFADAGKVQLINLLSGVYTVLAEYVYDGTGITEYRYVRPIAPRFFPVGENETTPAGLSLNFCGYYYSTGWSTSIMASSYGSNNACLVLPVTFTDFAYSIINSKVRLHWKAAPWPGNDFFEVERSGDGIHFRKLGAIPARSISNLPVEYSYVDDNPAEINYYRIKQAGANGQPGYSNTLRVKMKELNPLSVFQTLVINKLQLHISLPQREIGHIEVFDMPGRTMIQLTGRSGYNETNVSNLIAGSYLIRLQTTDGRSYIQRFVKQ